MIYALGVWCWYVLHRGICCILSSVFPLHHPVVNDHQPKVCSARYNLSDLNTSAVHIPKILDTTKKRANAPTRRGTNWLLHNYYCVPETHRQHPCTNSSKTSPSGHPMNATQHLLHVRRWFDCGGVCGPPTSVHSCRVSIFPGDSICEKTATYPPLVFKFSAHRGKRLQYKPLPHHPR